MSLQLFDIWFELEEAKINKHPYGGDIVKIYAQHFVSGKPNEDQWVEAGQRLYAMLTKFCILNNTNAYIDGREIGDWMKEYRFFHNCDVRIANHESMRQKRSRSEKEISKVFENYDFFSTKGEVLHRTTNHSSEKVLPHISTDTSKTILGELEQCKIPKKSTGLRLKSLLKRLWLIMSFQQNKRKAL